MLRARYVSINSQYYHILCVDNPEADALERKQAAWAEQQMSAGATAGAVHVVVLSHITPFMGAEDEEVRVGVRVRVRVRARVSSLHGGRGRGGARGRGSRPTPITP